MDEISRLKREIEEYQKNLEQLVTARTEQLRQALGLNHEVFESLKQIRLMKSVEQIQGTVQTLMKKLEPHVPTEPPSFSGNPGEHVPQVDPDDLKAIWELGREVERDHPEGNGAIGLGLLKHACKPGADIEAVTYRGSMLGILDMVAQEQLAPWKKEGLLDDSVFHTAATIPLEWMGVGIVRQGLPFDVNEFFRRLREDYAGGTA